MTLMLRQTLIALSLFLVACGGSTSNIKRYTARGTIDSQKISNKSKSADDSDFENPDTVLHDYYRTCKDTLKIDTTIYSNKKPVHIQFQHYSTNDSAIHLPDYYVSTYGLRNFVTHDFESHLRVTSNDSVLADATIDKNTFVQYANPEEVSFGTLLHPDIKFKSKAFTIYYDYVIPLTDVGIGVSLNYSYEGKLTATNH